MGSNSSNERACISSVPGPPGQPAWHALVILAGVGERGVIIVGITITILMMMMVDKKCPAQWRPWASLQVQSRVGVWEETPPRGGHSVG